MAQPTTLEHSASRHHHLVQSPYKVPTLPLLHPQPCVTGGPPRAVQRSRSVADIRSVAGSKRTASSKLPAMPVPVQYRPADRHWQPLAEVEQGYYNEHERRPTSQRAASPFCCSCGSSTVVSGKTRSDQRLFSGLRHRVKATLKDMFKREHDQDGEFVEIDRSHWAE